MSPYSEVELFLRQPENLEDSKKYAPIIADLVKYQQRLQALKRYSLTVNLIQQLVNVIKFEIHKKNEGIARKLCTTLKNAIELVQGKNIRPLEDKALFDALSHMCANRLQPVCQLLRHQGVLKRSGEDTPGYLYILTKIAEILASHQSTCSAFAAALSSRRLS